MARAKVSAKGWIVIPAELRKRYGIEPGDNVHIVDYGGTLVVVPTMKDPVEDALGILASDGPPLTEDLLRERRKEREREQREDERRGRGGN